MPETGLTPAETILVEELDQNMTRSNQAVDPG
jgi:hypothetical protein